MAKAILLFDKIIENSMTHFIGFLGLRRVKIDSVKGFMQTYVHIIAFFDLINRPDVF